MRKIIIAAGIGALLIAGQAAAGAAATVKIVDRLDGAVVLELETKAPAADIRVGRDTIAQDGLVPTEEFVVDVELGPQGTPMAPGGGFGGSFGGGGFGGAGGLIGIAIAIPVAINVFGDDGQTD